MHGVRWNRAKEDRVQWSRAPSIRTVSSNVISNQLRAWSHSEVSLVSVFERWASSNPMEKSSFELWAAPKHCRSSLFDLLAAPKHCRSSFFDFWQLRSTAGAAFSSSWHLHGAAGAAFSSSWQLRSTAGAAFLKAKKLRSMLGAAFSSWGWYFRWFYRGNAVPVQKNQGFSASERECPKPALSPRRPWSDERELLYRCAPSPQT